LKSDGDLPHGSGNQGRFDAELGEETQEFLLNTC